MKLGNLLESFAGCRRDTDNIDALPLQQFASLVQEGLVFVHDHTPHAPSMPVLVHVGIAASWNLSVAQTAPTTVYCS